MLEWLRNLGQAVGPSETDLPSETDSSDAASERLDDAEKAANDEWVAALEGPDRDPQAIDDLRQTLVQGLRAALSKRVPRRANALAEDFAQDALLKILDNLDTFRGESKFTTWAQKIAVRTAFTELRRKRWENVSLDEMRSDETGSPSPGVMASSDVQHDPEESASQHALMQLVQQTIEETLTDRQRRAITAVMQDMPLEEVARRMNTNRNALYKVIYDARQKLKAALEEKGTSPDQLLAELG